MNSGWQYRHEDDRERRRGISVVGVLLVLLGLFFLASEQFGADLDGFGWPVFVIAPGVCLLIVGLAIPHEGGLGAAIPGGIVTAVGLVLAFQNATGAYGSWAYAWAVVAPGSVGVTLVLFGLLHGKRDLLDAGLRTAATGLGLFVGFGLFFENIVGVDDLQSTNVLRDAFPLMAVGLGVLIVLWNLLPTRSNARRAGPDSWNQVVPPSAPTPPATPTTPTPPAPPSA
jgi:hypothetical protein